MKKEVIRDIIENTLEPQLESLGIEWKPNQKAAWASLYYNGGTSWKTKALQIVKYIQEGKESEAKDLWLSCYNNDGSKLGHQRRRATEWTLFTTGNWENSDDWKNQCYNKLY